MRIVFMGTPSYATVIFETLLKEEDIEVTALITQPDKPVGRKQLLTPPDIKQFCIDKEIVIDIYQPKTLRSPESINYIRDQNPDFIVVAAFGQILPKEVLDIAPCINLHASLLPKYRGASPIQEAILQQDYYSGVTAMLMDVGLDTGAMLGFEFLPIESLNAIVLFDKLSHCAASLCVQTLKEFDNIQPLSQQECMSSYAKKISKADGEVVLDDASGVYAKYLAFIFWPGIYLHSGLKLKKLKLIDKDTVSQEGEILEIFDDSILVGCQKGILQLYKVQPPSKKEMSVVDYIRGKRLGIGDIIS